MGATDLIFKLRSDGYSIKADGGYLDIFPADDLSPELVKQLKLGKPEILSALGREEKAREIRRDKAFAMLEANPNSRRVVHTDTQNDKNSVILTIAVRNIAVTEMAIPREKYNPWKLMTVLDEAVH